MGSSDTIVDDVVELIVVSIIILAGFFAMSQYVITVNSSIYDDTGYDKVKIESRVDGTDTLMHWIFPAEYVAYAYYIADYDEGAKLAPLRYAQFPLTVEDNHMFQLAPSATMSDWLTAKFTQFIQTSFIGKFHVQHFTDNWHTIKYNLELLPDTEGKYIWTFHPQE